MKKRCGLILMASMLAGMPSVNALAADAAVESTEEVQEILVEESSESVVEAELVDGIVGDDTGNLAEGEIIEAQTVTNPFYESSADLFDTNSNIVPVLMQCTQFFTEAHELLDLVNNARAEAGLGAVTWDSELEAAACLRTVECSYLFDHQRPNGDMCFSLTDKMSGENIAAGYSSAQAVFEGWMNSEGHRANILNPDFKSMGVGVSYVPGSEWNIYWTQCFGSGTGDSQYFDDGEANLVWAVEVVGTDAGRQVKNYVLRLYDEVLGRQSDIIGLANWFTQLITQRNTGSGVAEGFFFSEEFENRNTSDSQYLDILYQTMFNRGADSAGKEMWQEDLNTGFSRRYIFRGFAQSQEFANLCSNFGIEQGSVDLNEARDQNAGVTRFVSRLYSKALGRTPDVNGLNNWTDQIINSTSTPERVAFGFLFSNEIKEKHYSDEDFVKVLYRVFLNREADAPGLKNWVNIIRQGMKREAVMYGISKSAEFGEILQTYGLEATQGSIVYVTGSNNYYHESGCQNMSGNTIPLLTEDAQSIGYMPCPVCH